MVLGFMAEIKAVRFGFLQNNIEHGVWAFKEIKLLIFNLILQVKTVMHKDLKYGKILKAWASSTLHPQYSQS